MMEVHWFRCTYGIQTYSFISKWLPIQSSRGAKKNVVAVARNSVCNLTLMVGTSDIPVLWKYLEPRGFLDYRKIPCFSYLKGWQYMYHSKGSVSYAIFIHYIDVS